MGRAPCCDKANVKKGPWSPEEDSELKEYIMKYGTGGNWITLPQKIGLKRCGKSCRLRWLNYLRPNIKHGGFSEEEDSIICSLYNIIGSRWSMIAAQLPGRTDNDIKNYWNTRLKKKLVGRGKDHQTRRDLAATKQESKDLRSYATSEANTSPNIYGPLQQPGGVDNHMNIDYMNGPYSNFCPGIISQLFEQNSGSTITQSSSSSEQAIFPLNSPQVLDQEVSNRNSCTMISTSSPIHASNCINASEIMQFVAQNQYSSSEVSYETAASPVLMVARHMESQTNLENPSASFAQNDSSLLFSASSWPEVGNYESLWMNISDEENNNLGPSRFSTELNDLSLYSNISPAQQREACNYDCNPISILDYQF